MEQNNKRKENRKTIVIINLMVQFFVEIIVTMILGYFVGHYIDTNLLNGKIVFTYLLILLGLFSSIIVFIRRALKLVSGGEKNEKD